MSHCTVMGELNAVDDAQFISAKNTLLVFKLRCAMQTLRLPENIIYSFKCKFLSID